ncbi:MAG: 2-amino-4-hydroxy-6-hydroxymethyldihydropteridine diphosphokinase [Saprospirales bacterium]|nr:2-amino-4-hydroxy-6-hydroxymethyldihydropteridine diphosphokinase [Saprospirales bacterium]
MSNPRQQAILHLGANVGNRMEDLKEACARLELRAGRIIQKSGIYETQPWGNPDQPDFLNMALRLETKSNPEDLLRNIHTIEREMGREREKKWAPRIIDIDLILFGDLIIQTEDLMVPHPEMHQRNFVLVPLLDIAADWVHPILRETVEDLYWNSEDPLEVILLEEKS